jgi:hypothetical protein
MLISENVKPLTGAMFLNVIGFHHACFGTQQLVTKPELVQSVELFIGGVNILDCMDNDSMIEDNHKLNYIEARLKDLPKESLKHPMQTSSLMDIPFQVGFNTKEDGFIEVLNSSQIKQTSNKHYGKFHEVKENSDFYTKRDAINGVEADSIGFHKKSEADHNAFSSEFGVVTISPSQQCWWYS